jgi:hypothetical protein
MTATSSFPAADASTGARPFGPGPAAAIAIALLAGVAVLGLFVAGITFLALAIAFPLVVPVAHQYGVFVSANDLALAERFAEFGWLFGTLGIGSFVAAVVVLVKSIQVLSPTAND